ncbi:histidinol dehydrogenase [soil metagenome]
MRVLRGVQDALTFFENRHLAAPDERRAVVADILADVRARGDAAVADLTERFGGFRVEDARVPAAAFSAAAAAVPTDLGAAIHLAAGRIRAFYEHQPKEGFIVQDGGALLGQIVRPLERVACYVPGGQAPLFSTLLMTAVPAQVAGVPDIVIASPADKNGDVPVEILAAAHEIGLDTVYRLGGPVAVAALAYGTATILPVDKIVGPGSALTMLAKRLVYGEVGIEALPGPTETLVLADDSADAHHVAADLLAQAEHDGAQPVLVTTSEALLETVLKSLEPLLRTLPTADSARASFETRGVAVLVETLLQAVEVANAYAPEHLCLLVRDPWNLVPQVKHAGGLFVGAYSMEALGDYVAGPSHVMPTGGTARFASAVNVRDFQKVIPLVSLNKSLVADIGPAAATMARAEGLEAHARAIESRLPKD